MTTAVVEHVDDRVAVVTTRGAAPLRVSPVRRNVPVAVPFATPRNRPQLEIGVVERRHDDVVVLRPNARADVTLIPRGACSTPLCPPRQRNGGTCPTVFCSIEAIALFQPFEVLSSA